MDPLMSIDSQKDIYFTKDKWLFFDERGNNFLIYTQKRLKSNTKQTCFVVFTRSIPIMVRDAWWR